MDFSNAQIFQSLFVDHLDGLGKEHPLIHSSPTVHHYLELGYILRTPLLVQYGIISKLIQRTFLSLLLTIFRVHCLEYYFCKPFHLAKYGHWSLKLQVKRSLYHIRWRLQIYLPLEKPRRSFYRVRLFFLDLVPLYAVRIN